MEEGRRKQETFNKRKQKLFQYFFSLNVLVAMCTSVICVMALSDLVWFGGEKKATVFAWDTSPRSMRY